MGLLLSCDLLKVVAGKSEINVTFTSVFTNLCQSSLTKFPGLLNLETGLKEKIIYQQ